MCVDEAPRDIYLDEDESEAQEARLFAKWCAVEPTYQAANLRAVIQLLDGRALCGLKF